jgi:hypothetical protein
MRKAILISAFALLAASFLKAEESPADTTFQFNRKLVKIEENNDQIKVKVFEKDASNDTVLYRQLFEGIYSDEKSYEKWTVQEALGFDLPFLRKKTKRSSHMYPHWDGIGLGFANIADASFNMTEVDGVSINVGSSYEWFINICGTTLPIYRNNLGITSGIGISWLNLKLDKDTRLENVKGVTGVYPAPDDIHYTLSRLRLVHINIPLLLEWQPVINGKQKAYLSAGVVGGIKIFSSYVTKYKEEPRSRTITDKDRGLNTLPLSLDYMVQAGYEQWSVYAKYSPFGIFQTNKGPNIRAVSLGIIYLFDY